MLAKWFAEYKKQNPQRERDITKQFSLFDRIYTLESDSDFHYPNYSTSLIQTVLTNNSFYQKVINDSLQEAWEKLQKMESQTINFGKELELEHPEYQLFETTEEMPELSAFMSHCGSLGDLSPEGEYGSNHLFCMLILTDKENIPKMTATVGELEDPITSEPVNVIVNASLKANRSLDQNPKILRLLIDWAKKNNYQFADLIDRDSKQKVGGHPGFNDLTREEVRRNGLKFKTFEI